MKGKEDALDDEDRRKVRQIFDLSFSVAEELAPEFQIIITEHADLAGSKFQESVVSRWRLPGEALIPADWPDAIVAQDDSEAEDM